MHDLFERSCVVLC